MKPLTTNEVNAVLQQCGCCTHPTCCPPLIECRSGLAELTVAGVIDPDDSTEDSVGDSTTTAGWKKTRYLRTDYVTSITALPDVESDSYWTGSTNVSRPDDPYTSQSSSGSLTTHFIRTYGDLATPFRGFVSGSKCETFDPPVVVECTIGGTLTTEEFIGWYNSADDTWATGISRRYEHTFHDLAGTETEGHKAWETEHAAWEAAHPDWEAEYTAWQDAWDEWDEGGRVGDEPEEPEAAPEEPEEFYPECTFGTTATTTAYELVYTAGTGSMELVESTEEFPNPAVFEHQTIQLPPGFEESSETRYELPVTHEEFKSRAEAWINSKMVFEEVTDSDSTPCIPGTMCSARKRVGAFIEEDLAMMTHRFFQYRIKLDKCCGYRRIYSKWLEVFYPWEWLVWKDSLIDIGSDSAPPEPDEKPETTLRAWSWTGVPPLCEDSTSASTLPDPYDEESMWSPWSNVVKVPDGKEGEVWERLYHQKCYGPFWEHMPQIFGSYDTSESF